MLKLLHMLMNMKKIIEDPLIYSFFKDVKSFDAVVDFYSFCIKSCKKQNLLLDIGADMCEGLTLNSLNNNWKGKIVAFDLWNFYDPPKYENVNFFKGDAIEQLKNFFKKNIEKIDLVQFDIREINLQEKFPDAKKLDDENIKTEEIIELCYDNFYNGTILIITEFHRIKSNNHFGNDAYHLANFLSKREIGYNCIAYCKSYPLSAWTIGENYFYGDDLKNLLEILTFKK